MAIEIKLTQKLSQTLVMTPQLQAAIKLLQLGRQEYLDVLERELMENPVLEDAADSQDLYQEQDRSIKELAEALGDSQLSKSDFNSGFELCSEHEEFLESTNKVIVENTSTGADVANFSSSGGDSELYYSLSTKRLSHDGDRPSFESTISSPEGLSSHLLWQLRTSDLAHEDYEIACQLVGNLNRDGYLCCSIEEISKETGRNIEDCEQVLREVQNLDPPGIAARDLSECLLIQLAQLGQQDSLAGRLVKNHLSKLEARRFDLIAKEEGETLDKIQEAFKVIQRLEPRPGRPFFDEHPIYITPDIYVRKVGQEYVISLNDVGMPRLRLNDQYRTMLADDKTKPGTDKDYIVDRLRSAAWLIRSMHQRQQTIFKVTECIVNFQREFLEKGVSALKPMVLRDVAESLGMHESTISRVTTNKYVHTPQGVYELKFFFTSGIRGGDGEVSSESVKERIKQVIAQEDPKKPLSDQQLVNILKNENIDIARRTVAKYREMLNIAPSSRRKRIF